MELRVLIRLVGSQAVRTMTRCRHRSEIVLVCPEGPPLLKLATRSHKKSENYSCSLTKEPSVLHWLQHIKRFFFWKRFRQLSDSVIAWTKPATTGYIEAAARSGFQIRFCTTHFLEIWKSRNQTLPIAPIFCSAKSYMFCYLQKYCNF
jgi:hypothetical protein